ncbi:MAG: hypothetical protein ACLQDV_22415 [Candidatus Binataceae bacterium]
MSGSPGRTPERPSRGIFLTVMAVLFVVLAFSDFTKAWQQIQRPGQGGLVIFGYRLQTFTANVIFGPLFGVYLLAYVVGIWRMKRWVLPLAIVYAFYVPVNMVMFWYANGGDPHRSLGFIIRYVAVALVGSVGTALYLSYHRDSLS